MRSKWLVTSLAVCLLATAGCGKKEEGTGPVSDEPELLWYWGFEGRGFGQFETPYGVVVDAGGQVYVVDGGNSRIQVFDSQGTFLRQIAVNLSQTELPFPDGIALDGSGNTYVGTTFPSGIRRFDNSGAHLGDWPVFPASVFTVDVDMAPDGTLFVGAYDGFIRHIASDGSEIHSWKAMATVDGIDVDSDGNVFAVGAIDVDPDPNNTSLEDRIQKYDADGNLLLAWGSYGTGVGQFQSLLDIVVGPSRHVFVDDEVSGHILEYDEAGTFVRQFGQRGSRETDFDRPGRMAFGPSGDLFVTDRARDRVYKWHVP